MSKYNCKVIIFAGTAEGSKLCRFLAENQIPVCACVATDYGSKVLPENPFLRIHVGRLTEEAMEQFFREEHPELVLDATHPYAAEVTPNIRQACQNAQLPYQRVLREAEKHQKNAVYVEDTETAVTYLSKTTGNILLTTGSKELEKFTLLPDYQKRLYARVLSLPSVLETCRLIGLEGQHLIGMQGPFSKDLNIAMLRQYDCAYLVTKDTGKTGGFREKLDAAAECGVIPVIIGRPLAEEGISCRACRRILAEHFSLDCKAEITLVGIGMGNQGTLTTEAAQAVREADLIIGARRIADAVGLPHHDILYEYRSEKIAAYIEAHPEYEKIAVVFSGDTGFYSGAKKLTELLKNEVRIICGISSVSYFMSRIGMSWDDAKIVSAHGRECSLIPLIRHNKKVFSILGAGDKIAELAKKLVYYHMEDVLLYVGENLSYPAERIFVKPACELTGYQGTALSVVCACNENADTLSSTHGLPDSCFIRGEAPMTKSEIRTVSLSKLNLTSASVCYDIGAGTGSVAIEMALHAGCGMVYAVEKKKEAAALIEENKRKFAADNLEIVHGSAPQALCGLPAPTHVFIGGSSGNLREILMLLVRKNPGVRIVINCITLETVTEALSAVKSFGFETAEIVQVQASRAKVLGPYHMMMGENPIYVITCQNPMLPKLSQKQLSTDTDTD